MPSIKCAQCGMPKRQWVRNAGQGFEKEGLLYCCQGCAEYGRCTCRTRADRKRPWMAPPARMFSTLNSLIETCINTEDCYRAVAPHLSNKNTQKEFYHYANLRARFAGQLQDQVRRLGGEPDQTGTLRGVFHKERLLVESELRANRPRAILREYERTVKRDLETYRKAIRLMLPTAVHTVVMSQCRQIFHAYKRLHRQASELKNGSHRSANGRRP